MISARTGLETTPLALSGPAPKQNGLHTTVGTGGSLAGCTALKQNSTVSWKGARNYAGAAPSKPGSGPPSYKHGGLKQVRRPLGTWWGLRISKAYFLETRILLYYRIIGQFSIKVKCWFIKNYWNLKQYGNLILANPLRWSTGSPAHPLLPYLLALMWKVWNLIQSQRWSDPLEREGAFCFHRYNAT